MQVDSTSLSVISALNGLITTSYAATSAASSTSSFGPDFILSMGTSTADTSGVYSTLDLSSFYGASSTSNFAASAQSLTEADLDKLEEAYDLIESNDIKGAEAIFEGMLKRNNMNAAAIHGQGMIAMLRENYAEAEKLFQRANFFASDRGYGDDATIAEVLQRSDDEIFEQASQMVSGGDSVDIGRRLLLHLVEKRPDNAEARMLLGETLLRQSDIINGANHLIMAVGSADQDQLRELLGMAEELTDQAPNVSTFQRLLGSVQVRLGKYDEAMETFAVIEDLLGTDVLHKADKSLAYVGIGKRYLEQGDISRAINTLKEARTLDSASAGAREALSDAYVAQAAQATRFGSTKKAIQSYKLAADALGSNGSDSKKRSIAIAAFTAGLRLERESIRLGRDINDEVLAYQAAYDLDPDNLTYKRKLAETRVTIGDQYMENEDYAEAVASYKRATELYGTDQSYGDKLRDAYIAYGDELLTENKYDEAIEAYRSAYKLDTSSQASKTKLAEGYNTRGEHYKSQDKFALAAADFKEALFLFPDNETYQDNYDSVKDYDESD